MSKFWRRSIVLFIIIFNSIPMGALLIASFLPNEITEKGIEIMNSNWSFKHLTHQNFINILSTDFIFVIKSVVLTLKLSVITMIIVLVTSLLMAYILTRYRFRYINVVYHLALFGYFLPPIVLVIPFALFNRYMGLNSTWVNLVIPFVAYSLPIGIWLMKEYYESIPYDIDKITDLDKIRGFNKFRYGYVPYLRYGIAAILIFTFLLTWNDVIYSKILSNGDNNKTLVVLLEEKVLNDQNQTQYSSFAAISLIIASCSSLLIGWTLNKIEENLVTQSKRSG